jgi:hypothetical protein
MSPSSTAASRHYIRFLQAQQFIVSKSFVPHIHFDTFALSLPFYTASRQPPCTFCASRWLSLLLWLWRPRCQKSGLMPPPSARCSHVVKSSKSVKATPLDNALVAPVLHAKKLVVPVLFSVHRTIVIYIAIFLPREHIVAPMELVVSCIVV